MVHVHKWLGDDRDCHGLLSLGGRVFACHARRCAALDCDDPAEPSDAFCRQHNIARDTLGRHPRLRTRGVDA